MEPNPVRHGLLERKHVREDSADSGPADEGYREADDLAEPATEPTDASDVSTMAQTRETGAWNRDPR